MGLDFQYIKGQTPLDEDEKEGLKIETISTRGELDEFEQANIEDAIQWSLKRKFPLERILTDEFIKEVHRKMFSGIWDWAGTYRNSNKNIGVDKYVINQHMKMLLDECNLWISERTYHEDEITIRFKHRMVSIHPFPNGNGRHSRIFADILVSHGFKLPVFSWGGKNLVDSGENRAAYMKALRLADQGNIEPLLVFARS